MSSNIVLICTYLISGYKSINIRIFFSSHTMCAALQMAYAVCLAVVCLSSHPFRNFPIIARHCNYSMLLLSTKACIMTFFRHPKVKGHHFQVEKGQNRAKKFASRTLSEKVYDQSSRYLACLFYILRRVIEKILGIQRSKVTVFRSKKIKIGLKTLHLTTLSEKVLDQSSNHLACLFYRL